ncbi:MAG: N-acetylmuramoyl-L-alanine amidase [bacterium]|nr:MAG: N-acetylmuramoyl-L-alanine amidase [bacterium]
METLSRGKHRAGHMFALAPQEGRRLSAPFTVTVCTLILSVAVIVVTAGGPLQAESLEPDETLGVISAEGQETEDVHLFKVEKDSEELYLSAYDLARVFKATKYWHPGSRKLVLRIGVHRYLFTIDTRVVSVDEEAVLMRVPVRYVAGLVMIPLEFISDILIPESIQKIELDEERLLLTIGSPEYNITGIDFVEDVRGTRAVLTLTEELLYHVDSDTPGLLRLKIYGGKLNPLKMTIPEGKGLFNRVRAEQTEHDAYLFFDVKKMAARFRVEFLRSDRPGRVHRNLVIFLEEGELPEIPEVEYAGRRMVEILDDSRREARRAEVRMVAIDPGHGGIDNGKVSASGVMEKDINLEIALLLKDRLIEELGIEVVMTRVDDVLVPLDKRAEFANSNEADIFVSIHCNGWFHSDASGFETFFLSPARTEEEKRLANEENASIRFENPDLLPEELDDLDFILWDMVQNEFISESSELAELIQRELDELLDIRNRGVKQAGLKVLKGLRMPAVLIEVAFLSNSEEERLLQDPRFQRNVVRGVVEAVRRYQRRYMTVRSE